MEKAHHTYLKRSWLLAALAMTALAVLLSAPRPAAAAEAAFDSPNPITIPAAGMADRWPSTVKVSGMSGRVADVRVQLRKFGHARPTDVDMVLVSPSGTAVTIMSDACGTDEIEDDNWTFIDTALTAIPETGDCPEFLYRTANYGELRDGYPGLGLQFRDGLASFKGENPNGDWSLFVQDDTAGNGGDIEGGWKLSIVTDPVSAVVPATGTEGTAGPYPITSTVSGKTGVVRDVNVSIDGVWHSNPVDLDLLLVGPRGQKVVLMSDACGSGLGLGDGLIGGKFTWDDEAESRMPGSMTTTCLTGGTFAPTDFQAGDLWPAPAPAGPYDTALSVFNLVDPNGEWKLFANDDATGGAGWFDKPVKLDIATREKAAVSLTPSTLSVAEGSTGTVTVRRTAQPPLGPGSVTLASQGGSAAPGADFTPVATTVQFAAGEAEKTVPIEVLADGAVEPDETFTVALAAPTGDVALGDPATATMTIPAQTPATRDDQPQQPEQPQQPGRDVTKPVVSVVPGSKLGRDGRVKVRVRCSEACTGNVVLSTTKKVRTARKAKPRKLTLGAAPFRIPGAGSTTLKVKLSAKGRAAVRIAKRIAVTASATAADAAANRGAGTARVTLRR